MQPIHSLFVALAVFALIGLHVGAFGCWAARWMKVETDSQWAKIGLCGSLGLTLLGFEMLLLGHIGALTKPALCLSGLVMGGGLLVFTPPLHKALKSLFMLGVECICRENILALSCGFMLTLVAISSMRPPLEGDEREYHWAAPVLWASAGHWIASPYRLTNGTALAEMLYTFSACFHSSVAAHWTHALCLLVLCFECAALARSVGGSPLAAAAACLSFPVIVNQSPIAYSDVAAAALVLGAYTALFCRQKGSQNTLFPRGNVVAAGLLLAGAASIKPFTLVAIPPALLYVLCSGASLNKRPAFDRAAMRNALVICGLVTLTLGVWSLHTYSLIGKAWDSSGKYMAPQASDRMWQTGEAAGRIPHFADIIVLPTIPFVTGIVGQREPYGGRTGLVLMLFVPIGLVAARHLLPTQRQLLHWLLGSACAYFLLLGPFTLKTRFHIFVWCVGACTAAVGYQRLKQTRQTLATQWGMAAYFVLVWLGMADTSRILLRHISLILK